MYQGLKTHLRPDSQVSQSPFSVLVSVCISSPSPLFHVLNLFAAITHCVGGGDMVIGVVSSQLYMKSICK